MQTARFLIDLTTSSEYKGQNAVGIVRTEREITKAFLASEHAVGFFRYDSKRKALWVVPRLEASAIVGALCNMVPQRLASGMTAPAPDTATDELLQVYLKQLEEWLASAPTPGVSANIAEIVSEEPLELFDGDVVISAGLLWDGNFLELIYEQKKTRKLLLAQIIYDIIPVLMPEFCVPGMNIRFPKFLLDASWTADALYCISDSTMRDVGAYLHDHQLPQPRLLRVGLGADLERKQNQSSQFTRTLAPGRFVLYVSTIEPRKNHALLFHVWRTLSTTSNDCLVPLIIVGRHGWNSSDLISMIQASDVLYPELVRILTNVSDADLDWLYCNSAFTVYPSLYEGWGLPVAESLGRGKFCIAADTSSIPEVAAGFAELIDPLDFVAWTRSIRHYLQSPNDVALRERHIRDKYEGMSWESAMARFVASVAEFAGSARHIEEGGRATPGLA